MSERPTLNEALETAAANIYGLREWGQHVSQELYRAEVSKTIFSALLAADWKAIANIMHAERAQAERAALLEERDALRSALEQIRETIATRQKHGKPAAKYFRWIDEIAERALQGKGTE